MEARSCLTQMTRPRQSKRFAHKHGSGERRRQKLRRTYQEHLFGSPSPQRVRLTTPFRHLGGSCPNGIETLPQTLGFSSEGLQQPAVLVSFLLRLLGLAFSVLDCVLQLFSLS